MGGLQFRDAIRSMVPPWLSDRPATPKSPAYQNGFRLLYTGAAMFDALMEVAVQGLRARFPGHGTPTALPLIAQDRRIIRGLTEPDDLFSQRLIGWLDTWRVAGDPYTLLRELAPAFSPNTVPLMRVVNSSGRFLTLEADGSISVFDGTWNWDDQPDLWSRMWVIIYSGSGYPWAAEDVWGSGIWGDGGTWGSTATPDMVQTILAILANWKAAHALYPYTIVAFDPASFNPASPEPDGTWGKSYKIVGGRPVPSRLATARYWDGAA